MNFWTKTTVKEWQSGGNYWKEMIISYWFQERRVSLRELIQVSVIIEGNTYKLFVNKVYKCRPHQQLNHEDNTKPKHEVEARVKRRLSHAMNLMPMSKISFSRSVEIGSSHVKFHVLPLPINFSITSGASFIKNLMSDKSACIYRWKQSNPLS